MLRINFDEIVHNLKPLLERVAGGEEIVLMDQDREVARLLPPRSREQWLERTRAFRETVSMRGEALSETVVQARGEERY
jgi:antitoxin (DNA-binding transcriptional repressor) of toxin-antitoxin stability system